MESSKRSGMGIGKGSFQEAAIYGVASMYALIEKKVSDCLRPFNLTPAKFNAMMVIKHIGKGKGLSQIEIGRRLIVTASNMTRLLDKLENEGFIERLSREGDRRVNLVKISRKGSEILDKAWPGYYKEISEIAGFLNKDELKLACGLIIKWRERLEEKENVKTAG